MSLTYEPSPAPGVLQHTAPRPAVFIPSHPSDEELAFNWTLSERDIDFILTNHRGPENLCRLAVCIQNIVDTRCIQNIVDTSARCIQNIVDIVDIGHTHLHLGGEICPETLDQMTKMPSFAARR